MNIISSMFKKKNKISHLIRKENPILHFKKISLRYQKDQTYHKTVNIMRKKVVFFIYIEHLDISIHSVYSPIALTQKTLYMYIQQLLLDSTILFTTIKRYNIYACHYRNNKPTNLFKINKHSNTAIANILLKYNSHVSYTGHKTTQNLSFRINILIKPVIPLSVLYINVNNELSLCKLNECIICLDNKYVKQFCPNGHSMCFQCMNMMKQYKRKVCPMCRHKKITFI